jgi:hypothetical protein
MKKVKSATKLLIGIAALAIFANACGNSKSDSTTSKESEITVSKTTEAMTESPETTEILETEEETTVETEETSTVAATKTEIQEEENVPSEYKSALNKANSYSELMHMSKAGIYDQLTSEYSEQFTDEEAQYAVDHVNADWNANALEKAKDYQETMDMSPSAIHDQLTSEYGEQFTRKISCYSKMF